MHILLQDKNWIASNTHNYEKITKKIPILKSNLKNILEYHNMSHVTFLLKKMVS